MVESRTETTADQQLGFLAQGGRLWRRGYTTGSCAAAAAKSALYLLLYGECPNQIEITTPNGLKIIIPLHSYEILDDIAICRVVKDGGDDPDVTHGAVIEAKVRLNNDAPLDQPEIIIKGGSGVGTVTKPGLSLPVGSAAINPVPLEMIKHEITQLRPANSQIEVAIGVVGGEELAKHTMNAQLGIIGGISILGTTGIVEPMSEEAFKTALTPQILVALASGRDSLVLTPGRIGQKHATEIYAIPENAVILMSNFVGFLLEECLRQKVQRVLLFGHIGKLIKLAGGIFHTHNRVANARMEILTAYASLLGASQAVLTKLMNCITVEAALEIIASEGLQELYAILATKAGEKAETYLRNQVKVGVVFTDLNGNILGWNPQALEIGGDLQWNFQSGL